LDAVMGLLSAGRLDQALTRLQEMPTTAEGPGKKAAEAYASMLDSLAMMMQGDGEQGTEAAEAAVKVREHSIQSIN
jgi:hypothetical protein